MDKTKNGRNPIIESYLFEAKTLRMLRDKVQKFFDGDDGESGADAQWIAHVAVDEDDRKGPFEAVIWFEEKNGPCYIVVRVKHGSVLKGDVYATL